MGTRSLTLIKDEYKPQQNIICIYRQYDGYPTGHGLELAQFLNNYKVVNGLGMDMPKKTANGMGCLSAQLVGHLKTTGCQEDGTPTFVQGNIYLYPPTTNDVGEEYIYEIYVEDRLTAAGVDNIIIKCIDVYNNNNVIFEGSPQEFIYKYQKDEVQINN